MYSYWIYVYKRRTKIEFFLVSIIYPTYWIIL